MWSLFRIQMASPYPLIWGATEEPLLRPMSQAVPVQVPEHTLETLLEESVEPRQRTWSKPFFTFCCSRCISLDIQRKLQAPWQKGQRLQSLCIQPQWTKTLSMKVSLIPQGGSPRRSLGKKNLSPRQCGETLLLLLPPVGSRNIAVLWYDGNPLALLPSSIAGDTEQWGPSSEGPLQNRKKLWPGLLAFLPRLWWLCANCCWGHCVCVCVLALFCLCIS